jgi:hypothetical protein
LLDCKEQLGLPGQTRTVVEFDGTTLSARAIAFDQITEADAARINACAVSSATLEDGSVFVLLQPESAGPVAAAIEPVQTPAPVHSGGLCPPGRTGLYGGSSYCFAGAN